LHIKLSLQWTSVSGGVTGMNERLPLIHLERSTRSTAFL